MQENILSPPDGWWEKAFRRTRNVSELKGHPRGLDYMVIIVAYDITDPKRLKKVADCCKDFGIRVQYSIFECRLEADLFDKLWDRLSHLIDPETDRLVAYPLHGAEIKKIRTHGRMVCSESVVAYVF